MKENNGRADATRRLRIRKMILAMFAIFATVVLVTLIQGRSSTIKRTGTGSTHTKRRANSRNVELSKKTVPKSIRDVISKHDLQQILNADVHLVDLRVDSSELRQHLKNNQFDNENDGADAAGSNEENEEAVESSFPSYNGIYGTFCQLDWELHKNDPSSYPMFRDLLDNSEQCSRNGRIANVNIYDLVQLAREQDMNYPATTKALQLTGVVFHESRCGSTLAANILASINPKAHRVYSESSPPIAVLGGSICGDDFSTCNKRVAASMLRDVVYLMSRTNRPNEEERVFFKIQSIGTRKLQIFTAAFPTTPYLMVYRDPVQVMMSHLKGNNLRMANCVRGQRSPPFSVIKTVKKYTPTKSAKNIRPEDYCAAHLGSITETMVNDHTDYGLPINYGVLTDTLYNDVLPYWLNVPKLSQRQLAKVQNVAGVYSKNRGGNRVAGSFQSDSEKKDEMASSAVRFAAQTYLTPSYNALESLSVSALERIVTIQEQRKASGEFSVSE